MTDKAAPANKPPFTLDDDLKEDLLETAKSAAFSKLSAGKRLAALRTVAGLRQSDMADLLGYGHRTIAGWETDGQIAKMAVLKDIATFFHIPFERML